MRGGSLTKHCPTPCVNVGKRQQAVVRFNGVVRYKDIELRTDIRAEAQVEVVDILAHWLDFLGFNQGVDHHERCSNVSTKSIEQLV